MKIKLFLIICLFLLLGLMKLQTQEVVELPRPNSGTYSFEEAREHQSEIYEMTPTDMMTGWENPYLGFCVHITGSDQIKIYRSFLGEGDMTFEELKDLLNDYTDFLEGNPLGILITISGNPRESKILPEVVELLFKPCVQIFYCKNLKKSGFK
jgi:hypothetical protein